MRDEELARSVARCMSEGRARWPGVALDDATLAPRVRDRLAGDELFSSHLADVFVATAAEAGDRTASAWIYQRVRTIAPLATRGVIPPAELDELIQQVSVKLLLADGMPGRIASYAGRGPLDAWLRAVILRAALSMRRGRSSHTAAIDEASWLELPIFSGDPQLGGWRRHAPELRAAFETAIAALPIRSRIALRQHFVDGLSADEIGRIYGVHRITAYRWIAGAKQAVLERMRSELSGHMAGSPSEIDSLLRGMRSSFSITIERVLAATPELGDDHK